MNIRYALILLFMYRVILQSVVYWRHAVRCSYTIYKLKFTSLLRYKANIFVKER